MYHARVPLLSVVPFTSIPNSESTPEVDKSPDSQSGPSGPTAKAGAEAEAQAKAKTKAGGGGGGAAQPESESDTTPYRQPILEGQHVLSPLYLTAIADSLLKTYLPPDEYACEPERLIAREILGRVVLGSIGKRIGEPWFWWGLGLKFLGEPRASVFKDGADVRSGKGTLHEELSSVTDMGKSESSKWSLSTILATSISVWTKIWMMVVLIWDKGTNLAAMYTAAPRVDRADPGFKYRNVGMLWVSLAREVIGVDGREGLHARSWAIRWIWGFFEAVILLLGPMIDRYVSQSGSITIYYSLILDRDSPKRYVLIRPKDRSPISSSPL